MTDEQVLRSVSKLKDLMREHDWYYDYSDDHRVWGRGHSERRKIIQLIAELPQLNRNELIKLAPMDQKDKFTNEIEKELKAIFESAAVV